MSDDQERNERHREPRLRDLARRLFTEGEHSDPGPEDRPSRRDARELLIAALETGDKAKTEVVKLVAREVRSYLEALQIGDDIHDLLTNYSLEVHASFSLKPLSEEAVKANAKERRRRKARPPEELDAEEGA